MRKKIQVAQEVASFGLIRQARHKLKIRMSHRKEDSELNWTMSKMELVGVEEDRLWSQPKILKETVILMLLVVLAQKVEEVVAVVVA